MLNGSFNDIGLYPTLVNTTIVCNVAKFVCIPLHSTQLFHQSQCDLSGKRKSLKSDIRVNSLLDSFLSSDVFSLVSHRVSSKLLPDEPSGNDRTICKSNSMLLDTVATTKSFKKIKINDLNLQCFLENENGKFRSQQKFTSRKLSFPFHHYSCS